MDKKALSFIEILISITIIVLISTIGLAYKSSYDENKYNTKSQADLTTLKNSLLSYKQEK
jgi:type II secretory pathway pseudopilin PulG